MKRELDGLGELSRLALTGPATEDGLRKAADALRRATGATRAAAVYAEDRTREFLIFDGGGEGPALEFSQMGLWILQRQLAQTNGPVGFDLHGHRLEDFVPAEDGPREFLASAIPVTGDAGVMCILRGPWGRSDWTAATRFVATALPSLAILADRLLETEQGRRQRNQISALANAGQVLIRSHDVEGALSNLATALAASSGYDYLGIDVYDAAAERFLFRISNEARLAQGPLGDIYRSTFNPERPDPRYVQVVQTRQPMTFPEAQTDERIPEPIRQFFQGSLIRSTAIFPMLFHDEVMGVMGIVSLTPHTFPQEEITFLEGLAAEAATALKAMRTHRELVESQERLRRYAERIERQRVELEEKSGLLERALETEREHARRDPLTGVLNHAAIVEELRRQISGESRGAPCAIAMADVDELKAINDTFGHQVGDTLLVEVAAALSQLGALVGRYGGDEFIAVLPGADRDTAERYREKVVAALAGVGLHDPQSGATVPAAVSVGLATYPTEAERIEELIDVADSAMYAAKRRRPVGTETVAVWKRLDDDRAAKTVGELVPLLTSPGELSEKLRLVGHRLSIAGGYDAVHFMVFPSSANEPPIQNAFAHVPEEVIEEWNQETRTPILDVMLDRTRRPVLLDEPAHDQRLTEDERRMAGAAGVRSVLVVPMLWRDELIGRLSVASKRRAAFGPGHAQFLMAVAGQVTAIVRTATLVDELKSASAGLASSRADTVMLLAAAAEAHDRTTGQHLQNVRAVTEALACAVGYNEEASTELGLAAVLHDIGKIRVPDSVLANVGRLNDQEWELMKRHTIWGQDFLKGRPGFELAATIARSHHEHWDGAGYPDGLSGEGIPEPATIVSVADAFDAMTSDRPYRRARSVAQAMREISACSGQQFSPRLVEALARLHKRRVLHRLHRYTPADEAAA